MFISTILMVVVLVVALSTATFAWYTAQSSVMATDTTLTSATSQSASLALADNESAGANADGISVALTMTSAGSVSPMVPNAAYTTGTTTYAETVLGKGDGFPQIFYSAPVDISGKFTHNGQTATPATISKITISNRSGAQSPVSKDHFYIVNTNGTNTTGAQVAVNFVTDGYTLIHERPNNWTTSYGSYFSKEGDNYTALASETAWTPDTYYVENSKIAENLRVAVFSDDKLVNVWAWKNGAIAHYGTITQNNAGSALSEGATVQNETAVSLGDIAPLGSKKIQVVAWFNGVTMTIDDAGLPAIFSLTFSVVA